VETIESLNMQDIGRRCRLFFITTEESWKRHCSLCLRNALFVLLET